MGREPWHFCAKTQFCDIDAKYLSDMRWNVIFRHHQIAFLTFRLAVHCSLGVGPWQTRWSVEMQGFKTGGPGNEPSIASLSSKQRAEPCAFGKEEMDVMVQPNLF